MWRTPTTRTVRLEPVSTAGTPVQARPNADPVGIELADGEYCRLRNGGSWSRWAEDDSLAGFYSCDATDDTIV